MGRQRNLSNQKARLFVSAPRGANERSALGGCGGRAGNYCADGIGCFVKGTPVLMANNPFKNIATGLALATMPIVTPIQNIQVDDMVKAYHHEEFLLTASNDVDNIYVHGWRSYDYLDITPETWQIGKFIIKEKNGNIVEIEANRPKEWFENYGLCKKEDKAFITIAEMTIFDLSLIHI